MTDSQRFKKATDLIKHTKKVSIGEIAAALGVERHIVDNIRRGTEPNILLIEELIMKFPFIANEFDKIDTKNANDLPDQVGEPMVLYNDGNAWKQLAEERKEYLERVKKENEKLIEQNQKLEAENKALKEIIIARDKKRN